MEKRLVYWAFAGFIALSLFGTVLRAMLVTSIPVLNYSFLLHAHSHFGFAGVIFLSLALLIVKAISPSAMKSYRPVFIFTLISAIGMLITFSFQGYKAFSITFSTLFIFTSYYFAYRIFRDSNFKTQLHPLARVLIKGSLIFLCVSSLGPFSLAPLAAAGLKTSSLYNDAVYFYLHFQMNGWMLTAALALIANSYAQNANTKKACWWAKAFVISTVPLYFLFTLWGSPPAIVRWLAFAGAAINLISWLKLLQFLKFSYKSLPLLINAALLAITVKVFFQALACLPGTGDWVFSNRSLIIGYIHLLTLGIIMPVVLQQFAVSGLINKSALYNKLNLIFLATTVSYVLLLFLQPALAWFNISLPGFQLILLLVAIAFLVSGIAYLYALSKRNKSDNTFNIHP